MFKVPERKLSRQEIMDEVVANSKKKKVWIIFLSSDSLLKTKYRLVTIFSNTFFLALHAVRVTGGRVEKYIIVYRYVTCVRSHV